MLYVVIANQFGPTKADPDFMGFQDARLIGVFHDRDVAKSWADPKNLKDLGEGWKAQIFPVEMGEGESEGWPDEDGNF